MMNELKRDIPASERLTGLRLRVKQFLSAFNSRRDLQVIDQSIWNEGAELEQAIDRMGADELR